MTDAEKAFRIAEARVEKARAEGLKYLRLSPVGLSDGETEWKGEKLLSALEEIPTGIQGLDTLERLYLSKTQIVDLSPIAQLRGLKRLYLANTQVADISPLSLMEGIEVLDLTSTLVADLSPLARKERIHTLLLDGSRVEDLRPISGTSSLISGARRGFGGLRFRDTPATRLDPEGLGSIAGIEDAGERTEKTITYLLSAKWWPPVDKSNRMPP